MRQKSLLPILALFLLALGLSGCPSATPPGPGVPQLYEPHPDTIEAELEKQAPAPDGPEHQLAVPTVEKTKETRIDYFKTQDFQHLGYEVVIIVNKAEIGPTAQTMAVYHKGRRFGFWPTSTGREEWLINKQNERKFANTPTGFYRPDLGRVVEVHQSGDWAVPMPYSIFYHGGIAIHETGKANYPKLGRRASAGCVRLHADHAADLFELVRDIAGIGMVAKIHRNGRIQKRADSTIIYEKGYRTLIIVHDLIEDT